MAKKSGKSGSESRPANSDYGKGGDVKKSAPADPAQNKSTKNASKP